MFLWLGIVSTSPNPQAGGPPLVGCLWLFNIFAATLHIGGRSSILNLRLRHAMVTDPLITVVYNTNTLFYGVLCKVFWYHNMLTTHTSENSLVQHYWLGHDRVGWGRCNIKSSPVFFRDWYRCPNIAMDQYPVGLLTNEMTITLWT